VDPRADLWDRGKHSKLNCPSWPNRAAAEEQHSCHLLKTALTTLHELAILPHLTTPTNLVDIRSKYHSQASHLVRPHRSFHLSTNTRIRHLRNNSRILLIDWTTEPGSWVWCVCVCVCFFFFLLSFSFFISVLLTPSSLLSSLFSFSLLSLLLLYYNLLFSLPTTLSAPSLPLFSLSSLSHPTLPQTVTTLPSLLHTHQLLTSLLYQLHINPDPCNPWHTHPLRQHKYTKHTQGLQNLATPITLNPPSHSFSHPPFFSVTFINSHNL
jgi:hypothetical protein